MNKNKNNPVQKRRLGFDQMNKDNLVRKRKLGFDQMNKDNPVQKRRLEFDQMNGMDVYNFLHMVSSVGGTNSNCRHLIFFGTA